MRCTVCKAAGSQGARGQVQSYGGSGGAAHVGTGGHRWPQVATGSKGTYLELVNKCDRGARLSRANGSPHAHEPASHHHDILDGARGGGGGGGGGGGTAAVCRSTTAHVGAGCRCGLGGGAGDAAKCTGTDLRDAMHCKSMERPRISSSTIGFNGACTTSCLSVADGKTEQHVVGVVSGVGILSRHAPFHGGKGECAGARAGKLE